MLKLYNSLTRQIEEFTPLNPNEVGIYGCGPTVYEHAHIGNLRSFILYDILRKTLEISGFEVNFVENITDIEDKIIKKALEKNLKIEDFTTEYTKIFFEDIDKLNIKRATTHPKATEHISEMIKFIEALLEKKLAYTEDDGSVYFDVSEFEDYGKLSRIDKSTIKTGTRVLSDEYEKEDVQDFALWKGVKTEEIGWDSPWGKGRPGWHIECSVMSEMYLGETFDIHLGGVDLIFPHHENEIAQSEGKNGKKFVNYWVHGEHLLVDGTKMSKSKNNFYTLLDLEEKEIEPLAFRYLTLTAHYRDKLNFTWESLQAAQNALNNLREIIREWSPNIGDVISGRVAKDGFVNPEGWLDEEPEAGKSVILYEKFIEALNNDLNTPQAVAVLWELVKSGIPASEKSGILLKMDLILGLRLDEYLGKKVEVPGKVMELVKKREAARNNKDFKRSDELRDEIKKLGFGVLDTPDGPKIK